MPIKGVTDNVRADFPLIGVIRKGGLAPRSQNGLVLRPGADLDYFRFTSDYPETLQAFAQTYGAEPRLLNVLLLHDTPEENLESWREDWADGGLLHRCDGETCTIWRKPDGTYSQEPVPCPGPRERVNSKGQKVLEICKPVTRLQVFLTDLRRAGYVLVQSSSINDAINLTAQLKAIAELHRGSLCGIPMVLSRHGHRISTPSPDGKRVRRITSLLSLEVSPSWIDLRLAELEAAATPQAVQIAETVGAHPDIAAQTQGAQPMPAAMAPDPDEDTEDGEATEYDPTTGEIIDADTRQMEREARDEGVLSPAESAAERAAEYAAERAAKSNIPGRPAVTAEPESGIGLSSRGHGRASSPAASSSNMEEGREEVDRSSAQPLSESTSSPATPPSEAPTPTGHTLGYRAAALERQRQMPPGFVQFNELKMRASDLGINTDRLAIPENGVTTQLLAGWIGELRAVIADAEKAVAEKAVPA